MTRAEKVAAVAELRAQGLTHREVAARLGMAVGGVRNLVTDPDGSKQRARRERYRGVCEVCGGPTDGSHGFNAPRLCVEHSTGRQHDERRWTRAAILAAFGAFAAAMGRPPTAGDILGRTPSYGSKFSAARRAEVERARRLELPQPWVVRREFGSWAAGLEAAGYPLSRGGGGHHRRTVAA